MGPLPVFRTHLYVEIMKGCHPEYKPHLRMAAAKELIRQIEFDYEDEPSEAATATVASTPEPATSSESNSDSQPTNPVHPTHPVNADSDKKRNPASDKITVHHPNQTNHSSDKPSLTDIQSKMHIEDGSVYYRDYAAQHARESESIYQSIIRRASGGYNLNEAQGKAQDLIAEFDDFMAERDPNYQPIAVPDNLITKSLTDRMRDHENWLYDPADFFDLDQDYFYYCMCLTCEACDELHYFFQFMRELEEEYEDP